MSSPRLIAAAASPRSEAQARTERFIARQLAGLRDLGLSDAALAREEALLRAGLANGGMLAQLLAGAGG